MTSLYALGTILLVIILACKVIAYVRKEIATARNKGYYEGLKSAKLQYDSSTTHKAKEIIKREKQLSERESAFEERVQAQVLSKIHSGVSKGFLKDVPLYAALACDDPIDTRLLSALSERMIFIGIPSASCQIQGRSGNIYTASLTDCTCEDFRRHRTPCKHMYRLALELGLLASFDDSSIRRSLEQHEKNSKTLEKIKRQRSALHRIQNEARQNYPWMSALYADYFYLEDQRVETELRRKRCPALKAADELKRISKDNKALRVRCKAQEYQLHYYETLFPWLEEFKEIPPKEAYAALTETPSSEGNEYEHLRQWLSPEEYNKLSNPEKYQLALDRYLHRDKSNWEIGRDYERYIGYLCEQEGYRVEYHGALMGVEDLGRDLYAIGESKTLIIQCKRWASQKTIHEKHIFQLYGSVIEYCIENPEKEAIGVFVASCSCSDKAKAFAQHLNIEIIENYPMAPYPMVKCNISSSSGERIYHLPFDQQYDRVVIDPKIGECYTSTIAEAEALGFRRAKHWTPVE